MPDPTYGQSKRFAAFLEYAGQLAQAGLIDRARIIYAKAVAIQPEAAEAYNDLAWLLATCPDARLRDPTRAVEQASKAVERAPDASENQKTLGVARYRAGNWRGAIEALSKSEQLAPGKNFGSNALFLAMAHWQLGHRDDASQWYDRAVRWMRENNSDKDDELRRFRAEAAELLQIKDKTPSESEDPRSGTAL
jgi:tetratricopeptide (TPR) repeat protein